MEILQKKREILFLSIDGNHWDSLHSIWEKEMQEETAEVIVVQAPVFCKNPQGEEELIEYPVDGYPEEVPVYPYDLYDLEEHHPQIIYTNDPNDGYRDGVMLHPFYHIENLKAYAEKIVYIPYFYLEEPALSDLRGIVDLKNDILTPATLHADEIWLQSEQMKQIYGKLFAAAYGVERGKLLEQKCKGNATSKMDWIRNGKQKAGNLPKEWQEKLCTGNGTIKKVVLQVVTLENLMGRKGRLLRKLQSTMQVFEQQEEVFFLLKIDSDAEEILAQLDEALYQDLREVRKEAEALTQVIYDDSVYMSRALAISDAYYGENNRYAELFVQMKKPVMIEDIDLLYEG